MIKSRRRPVVSQERTSDRQVPIDPASQGASLSCPKCGATGKLMICPFMRGGTLADGSKLDYYRCGACNVLVSSLALQEMASGIASANLGAH